MDALDLEFIPRSVRDKLDRAAVKLHLVEWQTLSVGERRELCELPCAKPEDVVQFRDRLEALVLQRCGHKPQRIEE